MMYDDIIGFGLLKVRGLLSYPQGFCILLQGLSSDTKLARNSYSLGWSTASPRYGK